MAVLPTAPAVAQSDRSPAPEPQGAPSDSAAPTRGRDGRGTSITTGDEGPDRHRRGTPRGHDEPQRRAVNRAGAAPRARWEVSVRLPETAHTGNAEGCRNRVAPRGSPLAPRGSRELTHFCSPKVTHV